MLVWIMTLQADAYTHFCSRMNQQFAGWYIYQLSQQCQTACLGRSILHMPKRVFSLCQQDALLCLFVPHASFGCYADACPEHDQQQTTVQLFCTASPLPSALCVLTGCMAQLNDWQNDPVCCRTQSTSPLETLKTQPSGIIMP